MSREEVVERAAQRILECERSGKGRYTGETAENVVDRALGGEEAYHEVHKLWHELMEAAAKRAKELRDGE